MADFVISLMLTLQSYNIGVAVERPKNSYFFSFPAVFRMMQLPWCCLFWLFSCAWGGARRKPTALITNMSELQLVQSACHHLHAHDEWHPWRNQNGVGCIRLLKKLSTLQS